MKQLSILFFLLGSLVAHAQINMAGLVVDEQYQPIKGATITIRGLPTSTQTDADGRFMLTTSASLPLTLFVSYTGYRRQDISVQGSNFRSISVRMVKDIDVEGNLVTAASRVPEELLSAPVTIEKLTSQDFANSPSPSSFGTLQYTKGVDLMTNSMLFSSVNVRGFGSPGNTRLVQLTDGMDNRSPGLGFGFGNVAGLPDLDVETIELVSGAASALYGPDAMQGLLSTTSKSPFTHQGLSAQMMVGMNNLSKGNFGPKGYANYGFRYATRLGERFAFKVNFQRITGTDFIADDYADRSVRSRPGFFSTNPDQGGLATGVSYVPNNNAITNFQFDAVNRYGDDINAGGLYTFPPNYANALLRNQSVTRSGYSEIDLIGNNGKVFNNRANASLHYKLGRSVEASLGWYYGNGNLISTGNYRNYFPSYERHQFKAELKGNNFFLRAYTTQQQGEGWNIGQTAVAINNAWSPLNQWASQFGQVYVENKVSVGEARNQADRNRYLPGSANFRSARDGITSVYNTERSALLDTTGTRFRDNSALYHYEGMYNFSSLFNDALDLTIGGNIRQYSLYTGGTLFALQPDGTEYTVSEQGAYIQAGKALEFGETITFKPMASIRYDKNQYVEGVFSPRLSGVLSLGNHHFRGSWQSAFRNPTPVELFALPATGISGDVGGLPSTAQAARLLASPGYLPADVTSYVSGTLTASQLQSRAYVPAPFKPERLNTWEVGYRTQLDDKLYVDAYYFASRYTDLIMQQTIYQLNTGSQLTAFRSTTAAQAYRTLQVYQNSPNNVFVNGGGISLSYKLGADFTLSGNYAFQKGSITLRDVQGNVLRDQSGTPVVKRSLNDAAVMQTGRTYFNTPDSRYSISLSNPHLTNRLGASLVYRWTSRTWYEQGITQGDVWLPAWSTLDGQISYRVPALQSTLKLGATNMLNTYYAQGYGLARIGGLYYLSWTFDELIR
ncbi:TonB-dependent receptor domain-containing protein [Spirosoma sp. KUDC1026]|uniref:TonB-dependent receptor domain-containing protein n=1 Tax=Spirosoma sp. KUDC1026 TaxID=2745947 RepID=UPI00159BD981|nr:TonB-dependent receptor [Spirosoma sp. KUDC1026]QKZ12148.1 carboxypeptidase-like regulatory domain-containing protein [Spirosoma sp. KUDC1026]